MKNSRFNRFAALVGLTVTLASVSTSFAATGTWTSTTGANWEDATTAPWSGGTVAGAATFTANFTSDIAADSTVTLTANRTIGNLSFNDAGGSGDSRWNLASSGGSVLTLDNGGSQALITKTSATTISTQLSGSNIRITGGGALTLSGSNTGITGNVELNGNNGVVISNANALGSALITFSGNEALSGSASGITIANNVAFSGGVSWYSGTNALKTTGSVTLSGANQGFQNFGSGSITEWAGNTVLGANTLNMGGGGAGGLRLSGVVSGTGGKISKLVGLSTLYLTGTAANTFTGGITFNLGTIRVGNNDAALGTGTLAVGATNANASVTNLLATDNGSTARNLANAITITNNGTGTTTLQLDAGYANLTLSGNISGNGGISTASSGKVSLTGTNTYTGSTVLSGTNTLVLSGSNTTSGISVGTGTTVALRSITLSSTQNITGAGSVTKDISVFGDSTINGTSNTYTGSTTVNISRFTVGSTGVINGTSGIAVQGQWGANFNNLGSVTTAGAITVAGSGNTTGGGVTTDSSMFRNSGTISAGSMTLNSSSTANTTANRGGTYSQTAGSTTLSGALTLAANGGTGAAGTAGNDAAFNLSGGSFTANTIAVNAGTLSASAGTLNATSMTVASEAVLNVSGTAEVNAPVTMSSGSTLTGNGGLFNANVTINGIHSPGSSPGQQTFASGLTYGSTSTLNAEFVGDTLGVRGTDYDAINVTGGNLTIDLSSVFKLIGSSIDYSAALWDANRSFTVIDFSGAGSSTGIFSLDTSSAGSFAGEGSWALVNTSGDVVLNWTAVPEPASALLGGIGMLILLRRRRR